MHTDHSRRRIVRSAAWAAPSIAFATAAPAAAASPTCPTCLVPGAASGFLATGPVLFNQALLTVTIPFNIDSSSCNTSLFQPVYTIVGGTASMTMSDGRTYRSTLGVTTGAGTFGQASVFTTVAEFAGVVVTNGVWVASSSRFRPVSVSISFTAIFVGLPSLVQISCPYTFTYSFRGTSTNSTVFGAGQYTAAGTLSG